MEKKDSHPPRIAAWLIQRMFPDEGGSSTLGDMTETYRYLAVGKGSLRARFWFWSQCIKAIPYFLIDEFHLRVHMFKNYLTITLRNLKKNITFSSLNIIGLAVGMAAFILILLYVRNELSYDKHHENAGRIYRVIREGRAFTPAALGPELMGKIPEVESAARIIRSSDTLVSHQEDSFLEQEFYWADPEFLRIFAFPFVRGNPEAALNDPFAIVLSQKAAEKYFGDADPLGSILKVSERYSFKVTGVFADMPPNSHFVMDVVVPYATYFRITSNDITGWQSNFSYTYLLLRKGAESQETEDKIHTFIVTPLFKEAGVKGPYPKYFFTQPITEIHLHSHLEQEVGVNNDMKYIILFTSVAFLILFIACVNYMNLATARSLRRGKEVGMRKVVGAKKGQLIAQFLGESVVMAVLAMVFSLMIALAALPAFNNLVQRQLRLNPLSDPQLFFGLVFITLLVGLFAGSYPAMRMSGFRPIAVLSGTFSRSHKGSALRNVCVLVQFGITIFLIVCTLTVREQLEYIKRVDMGYEREQIITLPVRTGSVRRNIQSIKTALLQSSDIVAVAASARLPNDIDTFTSRDWTGKNPKKPIPIYYNTADYDYVDLFGMELVQGRNFSRDFPSDQTGAFLVNETAVRVAEWESPLEREFTHWNGQTGKIVGVLKDFHLHSLHRPIAPLCIYLNPQAFTNIAIKIRSTDIPETLAYVEGVMKKFSPGTPFSYAFFDEVFARAYLTDQRMGRVFGAFALLGIVIACLGLFGLATFAAEQRTKEIGIRKVVGASGPRIFLLLSKEFLQWVLLANLIAWPAAYFAMQRWLQNFAYRAPVGIAVFLISGGAALLIAYLTVSYRSIKSARANPVESLRYE